MAYRSIIIRGKDENFDEILNEALDGAVPLAFITMGDKIRIVFEGEAPQEEPDNNEPSPP